LYRLDVFGIDGSAYREAARDIGSYSTTSGKITSQYQIDWSADGRSIFYRIPDSTSRRYSLIVFRLNEKQSVTLIENVRSDGHFVMDYNYVLAEWVDGGDVYSGVVSTKDLRRLGVTRQSNRGTGPYSEIGPKVLEQSSKNKWLVYIQGDYISGQPELRAVNVETGVSHILLDRDASVALSPDGRTLAMVYPRPDARNVASTNMAKDTLVLVDMDTMSKRTITLDTITAISDYFSSLPKLIWSPDSQLLLISQPAQLTNALVYQNLRFMTAEGADVRRIDWLPYQIFIFTQCN
jgi:hypothetical protein